MKTVLLDVTNTIPNAGQNYVTGMGRASIHLLDALSKKENLPFQLKLYVSGWRGRIGYNFYSWHFPHSVFPVPDVLHINNKTLVPFYRKYINRCDLFHVHNASDVYKKETFVATIHDCEEYKRTENGIVKAKYRFNAQCSKAISTCSYYSKDDIVSTFGVPPEKVSVIHWGIDRNMYKVVAKKDINTITSKYKIDSPYFFVCSCQAERKNVRNVLKAFKFFLSYNPNHKLVLCWGNPPKEILWEYADDIEKRKILFLDFVTDDEIVTLYNGASLTLYPSRYEGFGFPVLESFACGTPVMICRNTSLPEVGQDIALYVGEDSIDDMVDVMKMFESETYDLSLFLNKKENVLNKFSWNVCAEKHVEFYMKNL